jgi:hypothetical protein
MESGAGDAILPCAGFPPAELNGENSGSTFPFTHMKDSFWDAATGTHKRRKNEEDGSAEKDQKEDQKKKKTEKKNDLTRRGEKKKGRRRGNTSCTRITRQASLDPAVSIGRGRGGESEWRFEGHLPLIPIVPVEIERKNEKQKQKGHHLHH